MISVVVLHRHEILSADHGRRKLLGLSADLRAFNRALGSVAVIKIAELIRQIPRQLPAIRLITAGFHDPVDDVQAVSGIAKTRGLVEKSPAIDASDIVLLLDNGFKQRGGDFNAVVILRNFKCVRGSRRNWQAKAKSGRQNEQMAESFQHATSE